MGGWGGGGGSVEVGGVEKGEGGGKKVRNKVGIGGGGEIESRLGG